MLRLKTKSKFSKNIFIHLYLCFGYIFIVGLLTWFLLSERYMYVLEFAFLVIPVVTIFAFFYMLINYSLLRKTFPIAIVYNNILFVTLTVVLFAIQFGKFH